MKSEVNFVKRNTEVKDLPHLVHCQKKDVSFRFPKNEPFLASSNFADTIPGLQVTDYQPASIGYFLSCRNAIAIAISLRKKNLYTYIYVYAIFGPM